MRIPFLAALVAVALVPGTGSAACEPFADPAGDAGRPLVGDSAFRGPNDGTVDLLGGGVAVGDGTLHATLRVASLAELAPPVPGDVRRYRVVFRLPGRGDPSYVAAVRSATGVTYEYGEVTDRDTAARQFRRGGAAAGAFDVGRSEVRISVPHSALGGGSFATLLNLAAETDRYAADGTASPGEVTAARMTAGDITPQVPLYRTDRAC